MLPKMNQITNQSKLKISKNECEANTNQYTPAMLMVISEQGIFPKVNRHISQWWKMSSSMCASPKTQFQYTRSKNVYKWKNK